MNPKESQELNEHIGNIITQLSHYGYKLEHTIFKNGEELWRLNGNDEYFEIRMRPKSEGLWINTNVVLAERQ